MLRIKLLSYLWFAFHLQCCLTVHLNPQNMSPTVVGIARRHTIDPLAGVVTSLPRGGGWILAGYHPFGYKITKLGDEFLSWDGSLESDVGRFLASVKSNRKTRAALKAQWLEILRVSKQGQTMRIYKKLDELLKFCVKCGFVD